MLCVPVTALTSDPEAVERIRRRYPAPRVPHAVVVALIVLAAALAVGWSVWTGLSHSNPPISAQVTGFQTRDDAVEVNLVVQRPDPSLAARCFVVAQATNYEQVGEVWVDVPPSAEQRQDVQLTVRTFRRATTAKLDHCQLV